MKKNKAKTPIKKIKKSQKFYVDTLCDAISTSEHGLKTICAAMQKEDPEFPSVYVFMRLFAKNERYAQQYAYAKELQSDIFVDQIIEISDDDSLDIGFNDEGKPFVNHEHIQRSRLRVDSRKWIASKLKPKKYGDKISNEVTFPEGLKLEVVFGDN